MSEGIFRRLGKGRFLEWEALEASGSTGGVLMVWDKRSLEVLDKEVGMFFVSYGFKNVEDGFAWVFIGVYGPLSKDGSTLLWEELGAIRGLWEDP